MTADETAAIIDALTAIGGTGTLTDLAAALSDRLGHRISPQRVASVAGRHPELVRFYGETVTAVDGVLDGTGDDGAPDRPEDGVAGVPRPARAVALDFEAHIVETADGPLRLPWQVGAVRFGTDTAWVDADRTFTAWLKLPDEHWPTFADHPAAHDLAAHGRPPADVAVELAAWLNGCDVLVGYNGFDVDYSILDDLVGDDVTADADRVDGLYLAHAVWPARYRDPTADAGDGDEEDDTGHRLAAVAARAGVPVDLERWHDAGYDAQLLADLVVAAAGAVASWGVATRTIVGAVARTSVAWQLVDTLAGGVLPPGPLPRGDARAAVTAALDLPPLRPPAGAPGPPPLTVPAALRDADGRVDPGRLAVAGDPDVDEPEPRVEQQAMTAFLRQLVTDRAGGLSEAPTGTGKTDALLAVALEWLEAHPDNRVIIATFTKQLQRQLAGRISYLDSHIGGIRANADLVKGARNRLSLRGLVFAAVACAVDDAARTALSASIRRDPAFRELVVYLLRRLQLNDVAAGTPSVLDEWESRSVDRFDLPPGFVTWSHGDLELWLDELSQGRTSDFPWRTDDDPLSAMTRRAGEAVRSARLIVANHALLLNVADTIADLGDRLLLLVDEAHRIEDAATGAFTTTFSFGQTVALARNVETWGARFGLDDDHPVRTAAARLVAEVDSEVVAKQAARMLGVTRPDQVTSGRGYLRRSTIATGLGVDEVTYADAHHLLFSLQRIRQRVAACYATLRDLPAPADASDADSYWALRSRLGDTISQTTAVRDHLAELLDVDLTAPQPGAAGGGTGDGAHVGDGHAGAGDGGRQLTFDDVVLSAEDVHAPAHPGDAANRVVWLEQLESPAFTGDNWAAFRFRVCSTPVGVGDELVWRQLLADPAAVALTSATLTVSPAVAGDDEWRFIRHRLGLPADFRTDRRGSPFHFATQARLVCFSDFPSWAEQPDAALLTLAHQLHGYLATVAGTSGRHGAMALTTSTTTARQLAEQLRRRQAEAGGRWRIHSATLRGNGPAVEDFKRSGGALIGTKGLWQGVDVANPDLLKLVWINKLPFPSFADPVIAARRAYETETAWVEGLRDPDHAATGRYYLPLAAVDLKQAVGRLIRTANHRGVVIISDRKLAGATRLRRLYRQVFLGGLDDGLVDGDGTGQVLPMEAGWQRIWRFLAEADAITTQQADELCDPDLLAEHVWLPQTLAIRRLRMTAHEVAGHRDTGTLVGELAGRVAAVGGYKDLEDTPHTLKDKQVEILDAVASGRDVLGVLPTGYGKSLLYQGPGLILPGVTVVISPLVSLMHDQALDLNRTVGGAVRALVAPMRESNSRLGKSEVAEQLLADPAGADPDPHGIQLLYLSPERLGHAQFQQLLRRAVASGQVARIALDEAHTWAAWGDDFRPSFRRVETLLDELKADHPDLQLIAVTATATAAVREHLEATVFARSVAAGTYTYVAANPVRPEVAVYRRRLSGQKRSQRKVTALVEKVATHLDGHGIFYCTTIDQVETTHAYLNDLAGRHRLQVLKYHGRMDEVAKSATMQAFHDAPRDRTDPDFRPTVVVATTAFGLGINRSDIRHVLVVSPPTDLAGLYQMVGRAGRDMRQRPAGSWDVTTTGMTTITGRNVRTLRFMLSAKTHDRPGVVDAAARAILDTGPAGTTITCSLRRIGDRLREGDVAAGWIPLDKADDAYVVGAYRTLAGRVFAALVAAGTIVDLGDIPRYAAIEDAEVASADADPDQAQLAATVLAVCDRVRDDDRRVALDALWDAAGDEVRAEFGNLATLWAELLNLHAFGLLDVSQAPNIGAGYVTAYTAGGGPPGDLYARVLGHHAARQADLARLVSWFNDDGTCCNVGVARYFTGRDDEPEHTCTDARWACSDCLTRRPPDGDPPALFDVFFTPDRDLIPLAQAQTARAEGRLDTHIVTLLSAAQRGLTTNHLHALLAGEDGYWVVSRSALRPVNRRLADHVAARKQPGLTARRLRAALDRLVADGQVVTAERIWWHPDRLAAHQARQAAARGAAAATAPAAAATGGDA